MHGTELGYPISANYDLSDDVAHDLLTVRNTTIKLGDTPLIANGTVNTATTSAKLDLNLKANGVSIAEGDQVSRCFRHCLRSRSHSDGDRERGRSGARPGRSAGIERTIAVQDLQASGQTGSATGSSEGGESDPHAYELHSDNFNVVSGGTTVAAQFAVRQYASKSPLVDATLKAPSAALPALLSMAKAYGVTGLDKVSGAGTLNLDLHAAGPVQSLASMPSLKALNGTLAVDFNTVRYTGVDVSHELATIGGFLKNSDNGQGVTNISRITGNIAIKNGIAQTSNLQAVLDVGTVAATGTAKPSGPDAQPARDRCPEQNRKPAGGRRQHWRLPADRSGQQSRRVGDPRDYHGHVR